MDLYTPQNITPDTKAAFTQDTRWLATSVWDTATQRHNTYT
jgi:hypothetical protein